MPPEPSRVNWLEFSCVTNTCQPLDHKDAWLLYRKRGFWVCNLRLVCLLNKTGVMVILYLVFGTFFWNVFFFPSQTITSMFQWIGFTQRKNQLESNNRTANSKHEFLQIPLIFPKLDHHCQPYFLLFRKLGGWGWRGFSKRKNDILRTNSKLTNCDAKYVMNLHVCLATVPNRSLSFTKFYY